MDRHTDRQTNATHVTKIHFASSTTHVKCDEVMGVADFCTVNIVGRCNFIKEIST